MGVGGGGGGGGGKRMGVAQEEYVSTRFLFLVPVPFLAELLADFLDGVLAILRRGGEGGAVTIVRTIKMDAYGLLR